MSVFAEFMQAYDRFLSDNKIKITSHDMEQYGWKIGVNAKDEFQKHVDAIPDFEPEVKERFRNMFNEGRKMLGIHVISNPVGKEANKVYLYKVNAVNMHTDIKDVIFKDSVTLFEKPMMADPLGGMRKWRYGVKSTSLRIRDRYNVYIDGIDVEDKGNFVGEDKGVAVSGIIDYQSGFISINRVSDKNNNIALQYQKDYNDLIKKPMSSSSSGSGSSSEGKSGGSSSGNTVGETYKMKPYYFDKDNFSIDYVGFVAPMNIIWSWEV